MQTDSTIVLLSKKRKIDIIPQEGAKLFFAALFSIVVAFLIQLLHLKLTLATTLDWTYHHLGVFFCSVLVVFSAAVFLFAIFERMAVAFTISGLLFLLLGYTDYLLVSYRKEPFYPQELAMALNISSLAGMVSLTMLVVAVLIILVPTIILVFFGRKFPKKKVDKKFRITCIILTAIFFTGFMTAGYDKSPGRAFIEKFGAVFPRYSDNALKSFEDNGFVVGFLGQMGRPIMQKPPGYSKDEIVAIAAKYQPDKPRNGIEAPPNTDIIFVMSEAFTNPKKMLGEGIVENPTPFIDSVVAEYPSGNILTPGHGGGTAQCEFEALTSFSTALTSSISPYENVVAQSDFFPSFVGTLADYGYKTTAIHPYHSKMYARPKAYAALGFDSFITQEDLPNAQKIENSDYISDKSSYDAVLKVLEAGDENQFIHLVTMQNHGGYQKSRYTNRIELKVGVNKDEGQELETYLEGLKLTDDATKDFLQSLSQRDKNTVVIFWGDHQPFGLSSLEDADTVKNYQTPFFIWSNFELDEMENKDINTISPIYLQPIIFDMLKITKSPFLELVSRMSKVLPGVHPNFFLDKDYSLKEFDDLTGEEKTLLEDYRMIEYDVLYGERISISSHLFANQAK